MRNLVAITNALEFGTSSHEHLIFRTETHSRAEMSLEEGTVHVPRTLLIFYGTTHILDTNLLV